MRASASMATANNFFIMCVSSISESLVGTTGVTFGHFDFSGCDWSGCSESKRQHGDGKDFFHHGSHLSVRNP